VLAIDQVADERADKATVAKSVTLEVDMTGAQKLSLAGSVGTLSLMLRKAGEANAAKGRRVTLEDLSNVEEMPEGPVRTIVVRRGGVKHEISVPIDDEDPKAAELKSELPQKKRAGKQ
jgi:pilus assembly protein CpaB